MRSNSISLKTRGFDNLLENFDKIEDAIVNNSEEILMDAAEIFLEAAIEKAPTATKRLKESLEIKKLEFEKDKIRIGVGPVGEDIFYWFFVEFGTAKDAAQPFLRPAYDENKLAVQTEIAKNLKKVVERQGIK